VLYRRIQTLTRPVVKAIIVDCDDTLWTGICAESGVEVDALRKQMQQFLLAQRAAGRLICVCSKNNVTDVDAVFDRHPDMLLKQSDITCWRVNWDDKVKNIQSIADELGFALNSLVFVDDNALECAAVREVLPEVITLQMPQQQADLKKLLNHTWAFDQSIVTMTDSARAEHYRLEAKRRTLRESAGSLDLFLSALALRVEISALDASDGSQLARAAQLTQRTTQFNLSGRRYTEPELRASLARHGEHWRAVQVADRYGDYGFVGLINMRQDLPTAVLHVDTFLLSCRALGRSVEAKMRAYCLEFGAKIGCDTLLWRCVPNARNQPVQEFVRSLGKLAVDCADEIIVYTNAVSGDSVTDVMPRQENL
jgi:FkbH-like protein